MRSWIVRGLLALVLIGMVAVTGLYFYVSQDLPSVDALKAYEPPLPTNIRDVNGDPLHAYARERRVELNFNEYPPLLVRAFLAAEDKTFFAHHGVDFTGVAGAIVDYVTKMGTGQRARGGSTITQQVAKNLLIGNEYSATRKMKEAILAWRIEDTLSKQQILELYLNTIFLGRNAYGVAAASHAYFGKELDQLSLSQFAYLAILPKAPSGYDPVRNADRAMARRNWVLGEMKTNGFITDGQYQEAVDQPLGAINRDEQQLVADDNTVGNGGYFVEEVRRQLIEKFGESAKDGPFSVYAGGLWVRTSFDPKLQGYAQKALRDGLIRYDRGRGWNGPLKHVEIAGRDWRTELLNTGVKLDYENWRAAIVTGKSGDTAQLGFADGSAGAMPRASGSMPVRDKGGNSFEAIQPGDIIAVAPIGGTSYALQAVPKVSGGFLVEDPGTGRVLAMQGGFDASFDSFNRSTQALRQPGSTIKPIVYAAGLEGGMTPATIVVDGPFCVSQGGRGKKCFRNFGGAGGSGPHTMRWGLEQSRNLMTVRIAATTGMSKVVGLMDRMGVGKYPPYLAFSLGAGDTTVQRMVNAYSILENNGRGGPSTLIDYVQDRRGDVIFPARWQPCARCNAPDWDGKPMPRPVVKTRQIVEPMSAYQMVHIAEGVILRGTATILKSLDRPIFGKTGTNSGPTDVWFIGGTPQLIAGVYLGYDRPANLGGYAQGGTVSAPIFKQWADKAYDGLPKIPFRAPAGVRMVRIDRASGKPVLGAWPPSDSASAGIIWEAFKPESEPRRGPLTRAMPGTVADRPKTAKPKDAEPKDSDFLQRQGGIY